MSVIKSLVKETAVYGLSSIVGRFLNWCLVPLYVYLFRPEEYGIVSYLYSYMAVLLVILNYGMETGFFRFANKEKDPNEVYTTTLLCVGGTSLLFIILLTIFITPVSEVLLLPRHPLYVWLLGTVVAIDAFTNIPFAYLRYKKKPLRFATLRLLNIAINIGLNLFFILACPAIWRSNPEWIGWFYNPSFGIGYIFLANLISSLAVLLMVVPEILAENYNFNFRLLREMLRYSFPILIIGIAGIMNQTIDKILYPMLVADHTEAMTGLGIYGANYKIAIVMVMFIQAFRFAYEPFIFAQNREKGADKTRAYVDAMTWFVVFGLFIFLGVMFYLPVLKYFISPAYFEGLRVVPIIMLAELFFGIFFNLSLWYKLTDRTIWGTWFSLLGLAVTLALNIAFVPRYGYMACAWAAFCCYGVMMAASYAVGRVKYPIAYRVGALTFYFAVAMGLWGVSALLTTGVEWIDFPTRLLLLCVFCGIVYVGEIRRRRRRDARAV